MKNGLVSDGEPGHEMSKQMEEGGVNSICPSQGPGRCSFTSHPERSALIGCCVAGAARAGKRRDAQRPSRPAGRLADLGALDDPRSR